MPGSPAIVCVRAWLRNGSVIDPPCTVTVCFVGACSHQSALASVTRTAIRWPGRSFQSADHRSSAIGPLERIRWPWRVTSGPRPFSSRS